MDSLSAAESKELGTKTPHEYIRDIIPFRYQECISCGNRTDLTCIRCRYCYSCHWKKERTEKRFLDYTLNRIFPLSSSPARKNTLTLKEAKNSPLPQQRQLIIDVHGRASEPICAYHGCDHKFSVHGQGSHSCKCKHPTNKALGTFVRCL